MSDSKFLSISTTDEWPVKQLDATIFDSPDVAMRILRLIIMSKQWIHRRVETFSFNDSRTLTRSLSVDFTIPNQAPKVDIGDGHTITILPIGILRRGHVNRITLRDEQGKVLSFGQFSQSATLYRRMLREWLKRTAPYAENDEVVNDAIDKVTNITDIKNGMRGESEWDDPEKVDKKVADLADEIKGCYDEINDYHPFIAVFKHIGRNVHFLIPLEDASPFQHRVIKYSYERPVEWHYEKSHYFKRELGLGLFKFVAPVCNATYGQSYHFELTAPDGLVVRQAELQDRATHKRFGTNIDQQGPQVTADLHAVDVPWEVQADAQIVVALERRGWVSIALTVAAIVLFAFTTATVSIPATSHEFKSSWAAEPGALITLFLTSVAVILALLLKPEDKGMATTFQAPVRRCVFASGFLPILFGLIVTLFYGDTWLQFILYGTLFAAAVIFATTLRLFQLSCSVPSQPKRQRKTRKQRLSPPIHTEARMGRAAYSNDEWSTPHSHDRVRQTAESIRLNGQPGTIVYRDFSVFE